LGAFPPAYFGCATGTRLTPRLVSHACSLTEQLMSAMRAVLERLSHLAPAAPAQPASRSTRLRSRTKSSPSVVASADDHMKGERREVGTGGLRRILAALAQQTAGLSAREIGVRAVLSLTSRTFSMYLSRARSSG
jgi:hypothetical protein